MSLVQASASEVRMLASEGNLAIASSKGSWILLSCLNRAFRGQHHMHDYTRHALMNLEANGTAGLQELHMEISTYVQDNVS